MDSVGEVLQRPKDFIKRFRTLLVYKRNIGVGGRVVMVQRTRGS